jgi:NAD(P)-dependent dehydrogenase (short-subunit alcohol dehydrogenase family)
VLVNNAGIAIVEQQRIERADLRAVQRTVDTNLLGAWRCCSAVVGAMRAQGYGRIVNISSHLASLELMGDRSAAYRVSKAGLNALTRILAAEVGGTGILVNAVSPGMVRTAMNPDA